MYKQVPGAEAHEAAGVSTALVQSQDNLQVINQTQEMMKRGIHWDHNGMGPQLIEMLIFIVPCYLVI